MREGCDGSMLTVSRQLYDFGAISANESKRNRTRVRLELSTHIDIASGVSSGFTDGSILWHKREGKRTTV